MGYRDLKSIGATLAAVLIRRKKADVLLQLPERMDKNFFVPMTLEQMKIHEENRDIVAVLAAKWRKYKFLTEADQKRLTIALQRMRMSCDNAFLVDKKTMSGEKINELMTLLGEVLEEKGAKVVVFSQWERMTSLIAGALDRKSAGYVHLHGGVPGHDRRGLIHSFRDDPACRVFLSTDAGGVGLNLQTASTVVNMDLPWNPAVLEQRIGRVHRLGQHRPVRVVNFVAENTIEHNMLSVLKFKQQLFAGVLEQGEDSIFIGEGGLSKFMKSVEEIAQPARNGEQPGVVGKVEKPAVSPSGEKERSADVAGAPYAELMTAGVVLLKAMAAGLESHPVAIETDEKTGRSSLKVPLPAPEMIRAVVPAVEAFLGMLKSYIK